MAPEAPDPQSLKTWKDAFQYPIPTVRRVEQELRRDIASNKEKLRALVGTRYRELVGTAETIISMNSEIQDVELILTDVGRRCNPRLVEKKHLHARQIRSDAAEKDVEKHTFGAQLALLHRCTTSIARLLRRRASLLLIAKILVVSRQLHNTLSKHEPLPPFLDDLRNQLASLRQTLLKRVNKRLASANATDDQIVEALAAYCLANSYSSDDAIHHFHEVRLEVIISHLESSRENIPKILRLFIQTLQTSKALRSRQFSDVLSKVKTRPILSDAEIRSLDGLEIEVLGRWVAPNIENFTPWIKLSDLSRTEGLEMIREWSLQAFEKFCTGCQKCLADSDDFSELLSLRYDTIELWLSSWGSTLTHPSIDVLERLRAIFNDQLTRVLTAQAHKLDEFGSQVVSIISDWKHTDNNDLGSLWDMDLIGADYVNGATPFKQTVIDRLLGRDDTVSQALKQYQSWLESIQEVNSSIDSLRRIRWPDLLVGAEEEDDDIEVTPGLNEADPRLLTDALHEAIRTAFDALQTSFSEAFKALGSSHASEKATFLLRMTRFVRRDIPADFVAEDFIFSSDTVPDLQKLLATETLAQAGSLTLIPALRTNPQTGLLRNVPGRSLWEGEPVTPVQPSPLTFKFLRRLTATMDESGPDLWDPSTLHILKSTLQNQLEEAITSALKDLDTSSTSEAKPEPNGNRPAQEDSQEAKSENEDESPKSEAHTADAPSQAEVLHDWKLQLFFDSVYLAEMLGGSDKLSGAIEKAQKGAGLSAPVVKNTRQLAQDYWKRTELLFGLLAQR
ncbi:hypothetical protein N7510_005888 [Penicillium lagena]|uniref:uncharacterized protein n=1 Tax=Penicillium lagena TaxID=94218 RepID=UPI002541862E|nr:uncharacterized protein N7510_005888 [Penicillium lagena]KAJ5612694.1 hypothetical protein N7510_005888 [Penicillium lagena]